MNSFLSKPFAVTSCVHERMLHLSVVALVLIASRPTESAQPDDTQTREVLSPSDSLEISPPVPPQPHDTDRVADDIVELVDGLKLQQRDVQQMGVRDSAMADLHTEVTRNSIDHSLKLQRIHDSMSRLRFLLQQGKNSRATKQKDSHASSNKPTTRDPVPAVDASSPLYDSMRAEGKKYSARLSSSVPSRRAAPP